MIVYTRKNNCGFQELSVSGSSRGKRCHRGIEPLVQAFPVYIWKIKYNSIAG